MKVFATRSAADEFARVLDGTAPAGPATAPLAAVAARVESARPSLEALTAPREQFRAALRTRLVAVASVQAHAPTPLHERGVAQALAWSRSATRRRSVGVAAGAMASVVAVAGVAVASDRSLPGEPFYGVKRAAESVQLRTADGPVERGTRHLQFATERLGEVRALTRGRGTIALGPVAPGQPYAAGSDAALLLSALADMDADTRTGSRLLLDAARSAGSTAPLELLTTWTADQSRGLAALLPLLPGPARLRAAVSLALVGSVGEDAATLSSATPPAPTPTLTPARSPEPTPTGSPTSASVPVPAPPASVAPTQSPPAVPPVQVPPVQLPPVPVPPVQLPPVQVPPVQLPPVQVPPVQLPPVQAPPPSVLLPSLPGIPLPSPLSQPPVVRPTLPPLPPPPLPSLSPIPLPSRPLPVLPGLELDRLVPPAP